MFTTVAVVAVPAGQWPEMLEYLFKFQPLLFGVLQQPCSILRRTNRVLLSSRMVPDKVVHPAQQVRVLSQLRLPKDVALLSVIAQKLFVQKSGFPILFCFSQPWN